MEKVSKRPHLGLMISTLMFLGFALKAVFSAAAVLGYLNPSSSEPTALHYAFYLIVYPFFVFAFVLPMIGTPRTASIRSAEVVLFLALILQIPNVLFGESEEPSASLLVNLSFFFMFFYSMLAFARSMREPRPQPESEVHE